MSSAQERAIEPQVVDERHLGLERAHDITAQELRIECFFPLDADTAAAARRLASEAPDPR